MSEHNRKLVMILTAILGLFSLLYPVVMIVRTILLKSNGGLDAGLISVFLLVLGFVVGIKSSPSERYYLLKILFFIIAVSPWLLSVFFSVHNSVIRMLFEVTVPLLFYCVGLKESNKNYQEILSSQRIFIGSFLILAIVLLSIFHILDQSSAFFIYPFGLSILINKNQEGLDLIFLKGTKNILEISTGIRKFNIALLIVLFSVTLIIVNAYYIGSTIKNAGLHSIEYLNENLVDRMDSTKRAENKSDDAWEKHIDLNKKKAKDFAANLEYVQDIPRTGSGSLNDQFINQIQGYSPVTKNPTLWLIFNTILYFIVISIVYKLWLLKENVIQFVGRIITQIMKLYGKLLSRLKGNSGEAEVNQADQADYIDEVFIADKVKVITKIEKNSVGFIESGRTLERLKKIKDPVQRVRYLYGIMLEMLIKKEVNIRKSDTTAEIKEKSMKIETIADSLIEITDMYERVRYGGEIPTNNDMIRIEKDFLKRV